MKKPNPKCIDYAMEKLSITNKDEILFIGDSATDIDTAHNAQLECWAVPYGYNSGKPIQESNPTKMIEKLEEIKSIL